MGDAADFTLDSIEWEIYEGRDDERYMNIEPQDESDLAVPVDELPAVRQPQQQAPTTAAQAKTDAVANLTMTAYQKASTLQFTADEIAGLKADFADDAFKPGAAGKEHLLYVEAAFLRDRLDSVIGMGQWALVPRSRWAEPFKTERGKDGSRVYVEGMLLIRGCFVTEAIGEMEYYPHNASQNYGDACEGAETACLRRCCKKLGVGLQAWKKDWCDSWWQRKRNGMRPPNAPPASAKPPASPQKPKTPPVTPPAAKSPPVATRTPKEEKEHLARLETWLGQCKASLLDKLKPVAQGANEYAVKSGMVMANETLLDVSLPKLFPSVVWSFSVDQNKANVKKDFDALVKAVQSFMDGDRLPDEDDDQIPGAEVLHHDIEVPRDEHMDPSSPDAPWRFFPLPYGKQAGVMLADLDKSTLWGWWANHKVETEYKGRPKKPEDIATSRTLRAYLDEAGKHYEFTKKD